MTFIYKTFQYLFYRCIFSFFKMVSSLTFILSSFEILVCSGKRSNSLVLCQVVNPLPEHHSLTDSLFVTDLWHDLYHVLKIYLFESLSVLFSWLHLSVLVPGSDGLKYYVLTVDIKSSREIPHLFLCSWLGILVPYQL